MVENWVSVLVISALMRASASSPGSGERTGQAQKGAVDWRQRLDHVDTDSEVSAATIRGPGQRRAQLGEVALRLLARRRPGDELLDGVGCNTRGLARRRSDGEDGVRIIVGVGLLREIGIDGVASLRRRPRIVLIVAPGVPVAAGAECVVVGAAGCPAIRTALQRDLRKTTASNATTTTAATNPKARTQGRDGLGGSGSVSSQ